MSEAVPLPDDHVIERGSAAPAPLPAAAPPLAGGTDPTPPSAPVPAAAPVLPTETQSLLDAIDRGLAPGADDATRATARDLWARLAQSLAAATPPLATTPSTASPPASSAAPAAFGLPNLLGLPASSLATAARALKQIPPDKLLEMVLGRLRAALPAGAAVPAPHGIQFQLVPMPPTGVGL
jgi:hypothetical protein